MLDTAFAGAPHLVLDDDFWNGRRKIRREELEEFQVQLDGKICKYLDNLIARQVPFFSRRNLMAQYWFDVIDAVRKRAMQEDRREL